jgi:hypothetical protein
MIMTKNNPLKRVAASGAIDRGDAAIYDLLGYNAIAKGTTHEHNRCLI